MFRSCQKGSHYEITNKHCPSQLLTTGDRRPSLSTARRGAPQQTPLKKSQSLEVPKTLQSQLVLARIALQFVDQLTVGQAAFYPEARENIQGCAMVICHMSIEADLARLARAGADWLTDRTLACNPTTPLASLVASTNRAGDCSCRAIYYQTERSLVTPHLKPVRTNLSSIFHPVVIHCDQ